MRIIENPAREKWPDFIKRPVADLSEIRKIVRPILQAVRDQGDEAVLAYTRKFDGIELDAMRVSDEEMDAAPGLISKVLKDAIFQAYQNIKTFHSSQQEKTNKVETSEGISCWRISSPVGKVGLYVPGGSAPLFSTVLMLACPASIAGCREIVLCSPPDSQGNIHPAILFAAQICGVHKIYKAGGAQAIAAMAYGTESIPQADKIFGPGNQFVTAAKQLIQQEGIAIDMPAGPSEVAVIADSESNASHTAADLIAQAEHGEDSQAVLLTDSRSLAEKVLDQIEEQLQSLPRKEIAAKAVNNSIAIVFDHLNSAMEFSNLYAPEHLIINTSNYRELAKQVENAGSVFLGPWTPESLGDYASGTNHTLPTNGFARSYSGVSLDSFVKKITFQEASLDGLKNIGECVGIMAENEELEGHKRAVTFRLTDKT